MPEVKKNAISFKSSNGTDIVAGYYYTCPGMEPRCILQISHGMCEYIGRYDDFAGYMDDIQAYLDSQKEATTIWDTAPQAAARTEQTAILPKRTDANLCCRICTK